MLSLHHFNCIRNHFNCIHNISGNVPVSYIMPNTILTILNIQIHVLGTFKVSEFQGEDVYKDTRIFSLSNS